MTKVALTGDTALELLASYFRDAGYDVMSQDAALADFKPDFVYDVTAHDATLADEVAGFTDARLAKLAGCKYSRAGIQAIVDEFQWETLKAPKKVLAVDADNTLWRGIVSEDGFDAVRPYREFQAGLRELRDAGVVLVLLSKNDDFGVGQAAGPAPRPGAARGTVPVDLGLFAVRKVNWAPKAGNLLEACRELNLSPDSVVFVDDNPHERAQMKAHLPEVTVAPFNGFEEEVGDSGSTRQECRVPEGEAAQRGRDTLVASDQKQFIRRLKEYFFFDVGKTEEDRLRAADYARQRTVLAELKTHDDYLDNLGLWVKPGLACEADLDRLAQMAGKTNQFNATTRRRTRAEFEGLVLGDAAGETLRGTVFTFRAGDRFGEQGLVCYVIVDRTAKRITDFVMSCRAMGRTLEHFALAYVEKALGYRPEIDFVPTAKNKPFADFLAGLDGSPLKTHFKERI